MGMSSKHLCLMLSVGRVTSSAVTQGEGTLDTRGLELQGFTLRSVHHNEQTGFFLLVCLDVECEMKQRTMTSWSCH